MQPLVTASEPETVEAGRRLAASLRAGDVLLLIGPLGAGKTVFARGLASGLGIDPREVHSPSYTLVTEHEPAVAGRLAMVHVDLYRIDDPGEIEELGLQDHLARDAVLVVEWGEKLPARLRAGAWRVTLEPAGGEGASADRRTIRIESPAESH